MKQYEVEVIASFTHFVNAKSPEEAKAATSDMFLPRFGSEVAFISGPDVVAEYDIED